MTALQQWRMQGFPTIMQDVVNVNTDTALSVSYVYAAVNAISSDIATMDWSIYHKEGDTVNKAIDHDQYYLINRKPYFLYNSSTFLRALIANYLLTGDGFAEIIRDSKYGRPRGYRLQHKSNIEIFVDYDKESLIYKIVDEGRKIDSMNMIHLSDFSYNGLYGLSRIGLAKKSLEIAMRNDMTQNDFHKNGTFLGGYIKLEKPLNQERLKKYRESFKDVYGGSKGEIAVLDEGATFTPFNYTMSLTDADFIASRKFTGEEILRFFRFPQHMANDLSKSSFNNIEHQSLEYVNYTLRPTVVMLEEELDAKLLRKKERESGSYFFKGDLNSLLRGDIDARVKMYETLWKIGALSANDGLKQEGMNPVEGGDIRYADLNKMPSDLVMEYYQAKIDAIKAGINDNSSK